MVQERRRDGRIAIDLDGDNQLKLLRAYFNALSLGLPLKIFKTGGGWHIRIYVKHSLEQNFNIRRLLGDDQMRLAWDEDRARAGLIDWIDTAFVYKWPHGGKMTMEQEADPLTLPFWSHFPCRKLSKRRQD